MASSRNRPGPHDKRPKGSVPNQRDRCVQLTRVGRQCTRRPTQGSNLCKPHKAQAERARAGLPEPQTERGAHLRGKSTPSSQVKGGLTSEIKAKGAALGAPTLPRSSNEAKTTHPDLWAGFDSRKGSLTAFVVSEQSKEALRKLGVPEALEHFDPKQTLLDTVQSAWRQRQIWEAMLNNIPEVDWGFLGMPPIPGIAESSRGARIEVIQKFLSEATKVAARASKLAIDAGIEDRLVRLAEEQSALIADTVRAALVAAIGSLAQAKLITPEAEAQALQVAVGSAANHLRALAATGDQPPIEGVATRIAER